MRNSERYRWLKWLDENEIQILLLSILALITLPPFLSSNNEEIMQFMNLIFLPIVISCFLIIRKKPFARYISIVTFILLVVNIFFDIFLLDAATQLGLTVMIYYAFFLVLREAISMEGTRSNMILISITGYMIIGLTGGFLAAGLELAIPESYYHSTGIDLGLYNFVYYSYVTMTTVGYGDIIPITKKSQSLALILVLAGQLYLAVIIAINISKFMQKKSS